MSEQMVQRTARASRWRWALPAVVVAAVATAIGVRPMVADASPSLPPRTAAELLSSLPKAAAQPFSGTVSTTARLGLPDLPTSGQGQHMPLSITSLLTGTHTLRVWYAGPDRQRVALVNAMSEADLIRGGQDVWAWNSDSRSGVHLRLPDKGQQTGKGTPTPDLTSPLPQQMMQGFTPQRLAEQLLAAVEPTTKVTVDGTASVAGREAYELVVAPRDQRSLVKQIRLAVDAKTSLALRLEVFGTGSSDPAIESGFTSISYDTPSSDVFRAPAGQMKELTAPQHVAPGLHPRPSLADRPRVHGSGWTTVLELPQLPDLRALNGGPATARPNGTDRPAPTDGSGLVPTTQGKGDTDSRGARPDVPAPNDSMQPAGPMGSHRPAGSGDSAAQGALLQQLLRSAQPVSGAYGSGRMLRTSLLSVLVLDDGRVFVGSVTPATLEQAATSAARS